MTEPILRVENLTKTYGDLEVLKGVSFDVYPGEKKVFIGPSGTGKSTLLRCINLLTEPDGGSVYLNGEEVTNSGRKINEYRQKMGMVFQNFNLFDHLTAVRNVELALLKVKKMGKKEAREKALFELERVGMLDWADHYPAQLSGGQAQRVSIARALAMDPEVMLFDEPTSALDPELKREVMEVMRKLAAQGMTCLVVTHEMKFATSFASEILLMEKGEIIERGKPEDIPTSPSFERMRAFMGAYSEE
ncbi:MAG: amino acid ABC transporter ATP-binding protein [Methanocorpusculum sp.]|jgi:polar amino acid transport system ATP-binding protein|nr:amino acid ABC transporter ATP-binding protein [Methanocorpusculum sp.]MBQ4135212.1 amino acid ABC transporter ATP-binding protein [Methanocorpusculum sp.]MBR4285076.1 amino acid ABC transporter ATP-binding protein [Methanocorpusculum sp.]MBR5451265.1 amino acid ABC transporter ATP-binding protein [Methanocorpusculum sp.]HJJ65530.1 amino acid ABC transporter ATP-binding protein [Methanocorpusculum sp.]